MKANSARNGEKHRPNVGAVENRVSAQLRRRVRVLTKLAKDVKEEIASLEQFVAVSTAVFDQEQKESRNVPRELLIALLQYLERSTFPSGNLTFFAQVLEREEFEFSTMVQEWLGRTLANSGASLLPNGGSDARR
jgi:hypothetical protein